ncbi:MAG: TGS domain-containing protein [Candidatus Diapherotrites archaeon]|nr:TGS domain-containing protein [Candidatus Diapherotrites archaeon]
MENENREKEELLQAAPKECRKGVEEAIDFLEAVYSSEGETGRKKIKHFIRIGKMDIERNFERETILGNMLYGSIAERKTNAEEIEKRFGKKTAELAKEAGEILQIIGSNFGKVPSETLSSIMLSMTENVQTTMIGIAAMLDWLRNIEELNENERKKIIGMTKEIYIPLVMKLGLQSITWQLQDYCFKAENPKAYEKIKQLVGKTREEREKLVEEVKEELGKLLKGKIEVQIFGRPKNFWAINKKMEKVLFKNIYDLYGIRIICNKESECYEALGYIHSKYKIIPGTFDDYISKPKDEGYQSIHTTVERGNDIIEFQIRTWAQHLRTESNLYWKYRRLTKDREFEKELSWERQLMEWQKSAGKEAQMRSFTGKKIFTFTPKNEVIVLPKEATVIDFAFAIHTDLGKRMEKAKVNGKLVPIEMELKNLDRVEIIASKQPRIKRNWVNFAKSSKAKTKIKAHFGIKAKRVKAGTEKETIGKTRKTKTAECCNPLPGEEVVGVKTSKRKIVIHRKDCINLKKISPKKIIKLEFMGEEGKTRLKITALDRIGLLGEILLKIKKSGATIVSTDFKIKKSGYVESTFEIKIKNIEKLEKLAEEIEKIPSVYGAERISQKI